MSKGEAMVRSITINIDKLYRCERMAEPCFVAIPFSRGELFELSQIAVYQDDQLLPTQIKKTASYDDGSVKFAFIRMLANFPANQNTTLNCIVGRACPSTFNQMKVSADEKGIQVDTGVLSFQVAHHSDHIFSWLHYHDLHFHKEAFTGPVLNHDAYTMLIDEWKVIETGSVCTILKAKGTNQSIAENKHVDFEIKLTAFYGKPWMEVSYRIINTTPDALPVSSLVFHIQHPAPSQDVRTIAASSNYKTSFQIEEGGKRVFRSVDGKDLIHEGNEHLAEVFYGTFFADQTAPDGGICATIYQAQQNFPKAVAADGQGLDVMLVPEDIGNVVMEMGMSREQKFQLHFHSADMSVEEIDHRSLVYQMPDRPYLSPKDYELSGAFLDVFTTNYREDVEQNLIARADAHARSYGMLHFGDSPDMNYTNQGRGGGELVWSNNEYDFPHACALQFVRTGIRRFLDYNIAACSHWMDVDVCHYHTDPFYIGGQWEHTNGHCKGDVLPHEKLMACSHEWVEGLLDYYHFTGDERGYETAIGIGESVLRVLETPMFATVGEVSARETGWALRTLTALYIETNDTVWLTKAKRIIQDFKSWEAQYGNWLAPYTDNTVIRVPFMISICVGSLMRYYRVFPDESLKEMMIRAVDDMIENCYSPRTGLFYYKELPSLARLGNNTLVLEALSIAYELTGNTDYLKYGEQTFKKAISDSSGISVGKKTLYEGVVLAGSGETKSFAQSFIPLVTYYNASFKLPVR